MSRPTRLPPRLLAALVFGAAGMLVPALWFAPVLVTGHGDRTNWLLYAGLPGVAAATAGALLGVPLVRAPSPGRDRAAILRGASIAAVALILFAPLYAVVLRLAEPGWTSTLGLALMVLEFGALAVGWVLLLAGGLVGWGLYRWALRAPPVAA